MVLKRKRDGQKRGRKKNDNVLEVENGHDEEIQGKETNEKSVAKGGITILEMTVQQFTQLFMQGYRVAKEEGFTEKDAEDFGIYTATRFAALWMEDRLAQKKAAEQKEESKTEEDNDEENDDE